MCKEGISRLSQMERELIKEKLIKMEFGKAKGFGSE
jgi:hypothetical protein